MNGGADFTHRGIAGADVAALMLALSGGLILASACRPAPADLERTAPYVLAPEPVEAVELFLHEPPERPWREIAIVRSEADSRRWVTLPETEAAAYESLRIRAAEAGAHAVIDIRREVLLDGQVIEIEEPLGAAPLSGRYTVRASGRAVRFR